jgi:HEAT repeat protein
MQSRGVLNYDTWKCMMKRYAVLSMMILVAASGGLTQTAHAGSPFLTEVAIPALTERLRDWDASVRQAAVFALREMGPEAKSTIPALAELLRDRDVYVAMDASHTIEKMGAEAVPSLVSLLQDEDSRVRNRAVRTLQQIGSEAVSGSPKDLR